jgi:hypothetical protein
MPCRDCTDPSLCVAVCQAFKAGQPAAARRCWEHPGYDAVDCPACSSGGSAAARTSADSLLIECGIEGLTLRKGLPLAEGFDGSAVRPGPNHSTIEIWYDTEEQARAAHKVIRDLIDGAAGMRGTDATS